MSTPRANAPDPLELHQPTPLRRLLVEGDRELWVKDDGLVCPIYGGNKPRKLKHILVDARRRGAKRLVTVGAAGSHHVLATGLLGKQLGLPTLAILLPRPYSRHAELTTKQALEAGVDVVALGGARDLPGLVAKLLRRDDYWVPPGGSNSLGAMGYLDATRELEEQLAASRAPEPDLIVVALGSGGTAAGILAGLASSGIRSRVVAVSVLNLPIARAFVLSMARAALRRSERPSRSDFSSRLVIDERWIGAGYGHATTAGELAIAEAASLGLALETTYTGKAFASALDWLRATNCRGNVVAPRERDGTDGSERKTRRILFWSTFSAVSLATATASAVRLPPAISRLLRPS